MRRHILVTGANGQLGKEIYSLVSDGKGEKDVASFFFTDRDTLDITDKKALEEYIKENEITAIVNCAAYTAVDKAEEERELAYLVNRDAVGYLAELSKEYDLRLIHISTDYVFDGKNHRPISENSPVNPLGIYGQSKYEGEKRIRQISPKGAIIVRTSWVYSSMGHNFVQTMLRLGKEKDKISVVSDQVGSPTNARDLAVVLLKILEDNILNEAVQTYHYSNEGVCSWYDFAEAIFEINQISCEIKPIPSEAYPTPAKRPFYSVLDKSKIKEEYQIDIPHWRVSLGECLSSMKNI